MSDYTGVDRRRGPELDTHFEVTQQNVRDISEMRTDIAGLKVGQDAALEQAKLGFDNTSEKFDQLSRQLAELSRPKPPLAIIPMFTLAMVVLGGFGTVMVFLSSQTATSMQREADMQLEHITERFLLAEQKDNDRHDTALQNNIARQLEDAYQKGAATSSFQNLRGQYQNLESQLTEQHRSDTDWRLNMVDRLSKAEQALRSPTGDFK